MTAIDAFWQGYVDTLPADHPHRAQGYVSTYSFGDNKAMQDELLALVLAGTKTATSGTAAGFKAEGEAIPQVGDLNIILDGDGEPACIVETTAVEIVTFNAVTAEFAYEEGEDDRSLANWRDNHERFWKRVLPQLGLAFDPEMPVVCERFRLLYAR